MENERLCREIENLTSRNKSLEQSLAAAHASGKKVIHLDDAQPKPMIRLIKPDDLDYSLNAPENADDCMLGISYGNIKESNNAFMVADSIGVNTIMMYCENSSFAIPSKATLANYRIVVHGPLNINIGSEDEGMRSYSVKKVLAIIGKLNQIAEHVVCLVLHPGSAVTSVHLIRSLEELLPAAKFRIAMKLPSHCNRNGRGILPVAVAPFRFDGQCSCHANVTRQSVCTNTRPLTVASYPLANETSGILWSGSLG